MKDDQLTKAISTFSGNIQAAYSFISELRTEFNFDLNINFDSSNSLQKFTNMVRTMSSRGLIEKPKKSGRSLILTERNFLQLVLVRKYLGAGCSMNSLEGYLIHVSTENLYSRLFADRLPDIDQVASRSSVMEKETTHYHGTKSDKTRSERLIAPIKNLFNHYQVGDDIQLQVRQGSIPKKQINAILSDIEKRLKQSK